MRGPQARLGTQVVSQVGLGVLTFTLLVSHNSCDTSEGEGDQIAQSLLTLPFNDALWTTVATGWQPECSWAHSNDRVGPRETVNSVAA